MKFLGEVFNVLESQRRILIYLCNKKSTENDFSTTFFLSCSNFMSPRDVTPNKICQISCGKINLQLKGK